MVRLPGVLRLPTRDTGPPESPWVRMVLIWLVGWPLPPPLCDGGLSLWPPQPPRPLGPLGDPS